jgi:hypothetical protein
MKREAKIIIPVQPSRVKPVIGNIRRRVLETALCKNFGGFTRSDAYGAWIDAGGELVREPVYVYVIAAGSDQAPVLRDLAVLYRDGTKEDCVYVKYPDGTVDLVS